MGAKASYSEISRSKDLTRYTGVEGRAIKETKSSPAGLGPFMNDMLVTSLHYVTQPDHAESWGGWKAI